MLLWQSTEKEKRDQKWREREGRVVNVQTVVLDMLSISCDSQANIMVPLCLSTVGVLAKWGHNAHYVQLWLLVETNGTETSSHRRHVQTNHRKSLTLPQKVSQRQSCWTADCRSLFRRDISQHSPCCTWHVLLAKKSKSESQRRTRRSIQVSSAYLWMAVKMKCRSCNDSRTHKQRQTNQILQVEDNIRTGTLRSAQASRTSSH